MKKITIFLLSLSMLLLLTACSDLGAGENTGDRTNQTSVINASEPTDAGEPADAGEPTDADDEQIEEEVHESPPRRGLTFIESNATSADMRAFEAANAVSPEQERYLAFGAFVMTNNYESIRVFALDISASSSDRLLRDFWSIEDRDSALVQLISLSSADGQAPVANDIYNSLVKNGYTRPLEPIDVFLVHAHGGLEHMYEISKIRAERMMDEFKMWLASLEEDVGQVDRDEAFEVFIAMLMTERINRGLEAYAGAKRLLINHFDYTEEELLNLPSLDAWDYGRAAIIARYSAESGYLEEDETWQYLKQAADSASKIYSSWREYTAAHILGRSLAFGNNSDDFRDALEFLLNHPESSFQTIDFKG